MAVLEKLVTITISPQGGVIVPEFTRQRRGWEAGTKLLIEEKPEGILLRPVPAFVETEPKVVFGSLPSRGKPKTLDEMNAGVLAEAHRRNTRGRD